MILQSIKKQVNISSKSKYLWFLVFWPIWKIQKHFILIPSLGPFSLKNDALPLNSLFWSPPTAVHRFDAWDRAVPGLYISWWDLVESGIKGTFSINFISMYFVFLVTILACNCYLSQGHVSCHKIFGHNLFAVLTFNGYKQTPKQKCLCVKCL